MTLGKDRDRRSPGRILQVLLPISWPMKLKCQPEDFRVEELPLVAPGGPGRYTFYKLTKREPRNDRSGRADLPALEPGRPPR